MGACGQILHVLETLLSAGLGGQASFPALRRLSFDGHQHHP